MAGSPFSEMESTALCTEAGKIISILSSKLENPTNSTETLGGVLMLTLQGDRASGCLEPMLLFLFFCPVSEVCSDRAGLR